MLAVWTDVLFLHPAVCMSLTSSNWQTSRSFLVLELFLLYLIFRSMQVLLLVQNIVKFVVSDFNVSLMWINIVENQRTCQLLVKVFHIELRKFAWWLEADIRSFTDLTTKSLQGPQYKFYQNQSSSSQIWFIWKPRWYLEKCNEHNDINRACKNMSKPQTKCV